MTAQSPLASRKYVTNLPFVASNVGNADGTLTTPQTDSNEWVAPYGGSIIGMSAALNGTLVTGSLAFIPTINGALSTAFSGSGAVLHTTNTYGTLNQEAGKSGYIFSAGNRIGLTWSKSDTVAPTTRDLVALLVVLYDNMEF